MKSFVATAFLAAIASAFTPPNPNAQTYGSLLLPDTTHPVTTGQTFTITWTPNQPAAGVKVSLVLCNGPSSNCVLQNTAIVEGVDASLGQYQWNVPCSLPAGTQNTASGYGMLIIVDGTGEFQYSTQFSVLTGSSCSSSSSTTTTPASTSSATTSAISTTSGSVSSSTTTSSVSGMPTTSQGGNGGWYGWSTTVNSTSSVLAPTTSSSITPIPITTTSSVSSMTTSYVMVSSSSPSTSTTTSTSASPKSFTGAAAIPTAFANAAGIVGAAVLGMMAL